MKPERPIKTFAIGTNLRYTFAVLMTLLPGLFAFGQVKFTTVVSSQEMGTGDYLQVEFVVENARQIDALNPPDFPGFRVAQGPIQSSGMSVINGNTSQYKGLSFVLQPTRTGKFTIAGRRIGFGAGQSGGRWQYARQSHVADAALRARPFRAARAG